MNMEYFSGPRLRSPLPTPCSPVVGGGGAEPALGAWGRSPGVFQPWEEPGRELTDHSAQPVLARTTLQHSSSSFFKGEDMLNIHFIVGNGIIKLVVSIFIITIIECRIACGVK